MPKGVYERTKPIWNKGIPMSNKQKTQISNTLKGNIPWNKGKKVGSMSDEHKEKIGMSSRGKTAEERYGKQKAQELKKNLIQNGINTHINMNKNDTLPERLFENQLLFNNILYLKQYKYALGVADFYLPESNTIVECDGIYWHNKQEVKERDLKQTNYLINNGYDVIRFTDKEIIQDVEKCLNEVI